jgi:hypothetical protein
VLLFDGTFSQGFTMAKREIDDGLDKSGRNVRIA